MALPPPYKTTIFFGKTRCKGIQTGLFRGVLIFMRGGLWGRGHTWRYIGVILGILGAYWGSMQGIHVLFKPDYSDDKGNGSDGGIRKLERVVFFVV